MALPCWLGRRQWWWSPVPKGLAAAAVAAFASLVVPLGLGIDPGDFFAAW
jgi:hypothetical protein